MLKSVFDPKSIETDLKSRIKGDIAIDDISRNFFSTDASVYRIVPSCVVYPKNKQDVIEVIKYANDKGIPVHARGAGSGLTGSSLGPGIVLAFRRYMNQIIEINEEEASTIVQPGVICGNLNHELAKIRKIVYVDNSSENYASIGGMIGTNSSGAHAAKYGYMADFVEELTVILSNGEEIKTYPIEIGSEEYNHKISTNTLSKSLQSSSRID